MALALAMVLQATPTPAVAVTGYDSAFLFESDWLIVKPGDTGQAAVTFLNVGSVSWQKGGASQVNLATCCPLNSPPTHAAWLVTPLSSTAYATHREDLVAPGGRGTYIWNFKVPDNAATGIYDFPGDLVLASTGEAIHREGYFHRNDNRPAAAPAVTPTKTDLTPEFVNGTVGANVTLTAEVTGDPETGSTTRRAVAGLEVTFVVDAGANDVGNSDFTRTASTDANGKATLTYTRSNPGTDTVAAYPTAFPTVRDTSTVSWSVAGVVTVTPDDAVTLQTTQCRTYTVNVKNQNTGANRSGAVVDIAIKEDIDANSNKTTATITTATAGPTDTNPAATKSVEASTDSSGNATFNVCGAGAETGPATPIAWLDIPETVTDNDTLDSNEFRDTGGSVTFQGVRVTFILTPDTEADAAVNGRRVFTIEAKDQFGGIYRGAVDIAFIENTDQDTATTTACLIDWYDVDESLQTSTTSTSGVINITDTDKTEIATLNSAGKATFAVTSASATSCVPVVWQDIPTQPGDNTRQTNEPQDTAGKTTFKSAALTSATLRAQTGTGSATNPTSSLDPTTNAGSFGEEIFTFTHRDQSGNPISPSNTVVVVTWSVRNTGSNAFRIINLDTSNSTTATAPTGANSQNGATTDCVGPASEQCGDQSINVGVGATVTVTTKIFSGGDASTSIELDTGDATSAEVSATTTLSGTATKTWIAGSTLAAGTAQGTILGFDTTSSGGWYLLRTAVADYLVVYGSDHTFKVTGTTTNESNFESKLSVGDTVKLDVDATPDSHEITTDVP